MAKSTEAHIRANIKHAKENVRRIAIGFNKNTDKDILEKLETLPLAITNYAVAIKDGAFSSLSDADTIAVFQTIRQMIVQDVYKVCDAMDDNDKLAFLNASKVAALFSIDGAKAGSIKSVKASGSPYDAVIDYLTRKPEPKPKVLKRENVIKENK